MPPKHVKMITDQLAVYDQNLNGNMSSFNGMKVLFGVGIVETEGRNI